MTALTDHAADRHAFFSEVLPLAERRPPMVLVAVIYLLTVLFAGVAFSLWYVRFIGWLGVHAENFSLCFRLMIIAVSLCWAVMLFRWAFLLTASCLQLICDFRTPTPTITHWPHVSILIPAYNESETIVPALSSLKGLDYPRFDVIVIDDGSDDDTFDRADRYARAHPELNIRVCRKRNGGKWSAHNFGFHHARGELLLCLDADSRLRSGSLKLLVERMTDPRVGGTISTKKTGGVTQKITGNSSFRAMLLARASARCRVAARISRDNWSKAVARLVPSRSVCRTIAERDRNSPSSIRSAIRSNASPGLEATDCWMTI